MSEKKEIICPMCLDQGLQYTCIVCGGTRVTTVEHMDKVRDEIAEGFTEIGRKIKKIIYKGLQKVRW